MKTAALLVLVLFLAGCGEEGGRGTPSSASKRSLPELARELVPVSARGSLRSDELRRAECGITPTYPCVNAFFLLEGRQTIAERLAALRRVATRGGWRVERVEHFETGAHLDLVQRPFHARYTLGRDIFGPGAMVQLAVYGPAARLPRPTAAQRASWTAAKRAYVREANAVCARTLRGLVDPNDVGEILTKLDVRLSALEPPPGDEAAVRAFLRPLHHLARSARALSDAKGEDALPAAVGVGHFTRRFVEAASSYGLRECVLN